MNHLGRSALCNKQDWGRADNVGDRLWLGAQGVCVCGVRCTRQDSSKTKPSGIEVYNVFLQCSSQYKSFP